MYSEQDYEALLDQHKWCVAVLNIVIQNEGGRVEIDRKTLEELDLYKNIVTVEHDVDREVYIIQSKETDDAV